MSKESEIKHLIRDIAAPNGGAALFEAEVVESKDTECTIKYQGLLHKNVRLVCGFSQSLTTIIVKPAVGSTVLVADLSGGKYRDMIVLLVEKAECTTINGGNLGGMVNIEDLIDTLKSLKEYCEALKDAVSSGLLAVGESTSASGHTAQATFDNLMQTQSITINPMEDDKVRH